MITVGTLAVLVGVAAFGLSQTQQAPTGAGQTQQPMTMKDVKLKLGIVVFPAKGQTPEQQEQDEYDCLKWAVEQAGFSTNGLKDPNAAGQAAKAQAQEATTGAAVKGAAKGAAVGALFGSIYGNSGEGAAVGAIAGGLSGRRAKKQAEAQAQAQAKAQVDAENKAKLEAVKKGMTACLESKGYTVQ
jgi:hypothetical protein